MPKRILPAAGFALGIALAALAAPPAVAEDAGYRAENPVTARSTLRWDAETVVSTVALDAKKASLTMPTGRAAALETIETAMPSLLADTLFSIPLDSSRRLGDAVAAGAVSLGDVYRIIDAGKTTPPAFSADLAFVSMTHTLSLAQIGSLFVSHSVASGPNPPLRTVPSRAYTGILIDARGELPVHGEHTAARLGPCLFPKIWDADMNLLYEKNSVDPAVAATRGIAYYSGGTDDASLRSRVGADPLRIAAREVYGINRTDPLVSREDFLKVLSVAENRSLLLEGKVAILVDAESLGARNLGPERDDGYYFVKHEIDRSLAAKPVEAMDFTDGWEGLKLTVYDIRFVADTAEIVPAERTRIDAIADALRLAGDRATFTVDGHTASVGKPGGEMALSIRRAEKIADELAKRGIERGRVKAEGFGGTRPIATNETDEGRAKNRRVEITIALGERR